MNFNFKKKFGQNFLTNTGIIDNIVNSIQPTERDLIIEIGPGGGALTKKLKKYNATLICYEVDEETKEYLSVLENEKTRVIYADFLKRDIIDDLKDIEYERLYVIGNLPYYITTPIITKILELKLNVSEAVFMVQKEVADRFSANPQTREYGSITVFLNYYFTIQRLFIVGKNNFIPKPNVDSAVIKLTSRQDKVDVNIEKFNKLVRDSFQFKRKNLNNNLKNYDKDKMQRILEKRRFSLNNRAEDLSYSDFVEITNEYFN